MWFTIFTWSLVLSPIIGLFFIVPNPGMLAIAIGYVITAVVFNAFVIGAL